MSNEISVNSDSSDDLSQIRASKAIQKQMDRSKTKLGKQQIVGKDQTGKIKPKSGGLWSNIKLPGPINIF